METNIIEIAKAYAIKCSQDTNHKYDKILPYEFHLTQAYGFGLKYMHLLPEEEKENALAGIWVHDTIEDHRQTYNDVKEATNEIVGGYAYALCNEKGKTRSDRANNRYYQGIRDFRCADWVKLTDRLANVFHATSTQSSMLDKYRKEQDHFIEQLHKPHYDPMFEELNILLFSK